MGIGDPAVRKPNSSVQSVPTYVMYGCIIQSSVFKKVQTMFSRKATKIDEISTLDLTFTT